MIENAALFGFSGEPGDINELDDSNDASRWGTACHLLSETCLREGREPYEFMGMEVWFWYHPGSDSRGESIHAAGAELTDDLDINHVVDIDDEQVECATAYVNFVRTLVAELSALLMIEQRVTIEHITAEPGAGGTADGLLFVPASRELIVADLKGGMARVDAFTTVETIDTMFGTSTFVDEPNRQLAMYADGALEEYGWMWGEVERVRLIIVQPRLNHVSEFSLTVAELRAFVQRLRLAAIETRENPTFRPSAGTCKFCPAQPTCKAFRDAALKAVFGDFEDLDAAEPVQPADDRLGLIYEKLPLVRMFEAAITERVKQLLARGLPVIGTKGNYILAEGRMGARYWKDPKQAELALLTEVGLTHDQAYTRKLITPAAVEALTKKKRGQEKSVLDKGVMEVLTDNIGQGQTRPSIALASSGKKAVQPATAGFENLDS
jgi:RecB family exonuclease